MIWTFDNIIFAKTYKTINASLFLSFVTAVCNFYEFTFILLLLIIIIIIIIIIITIIIIIIIAIYFIVISLI